MSFALRGGARRHFGRSSRRAPSASRASTAISSLSIRIDRSIPDAQRTDEKIGEARPRGARARSASFRRTPWNERAIASLSLTCDAFDVPTSKSRSLAAEVTSGRAFFGADAWLPAFVDLEPLTRYLLDDVVFLLEDPPSLTKALRDDLGRAVADASRANDVPRFPIDAFFLSEADVARTIGGARSLSLHRAPTVGDAPLDTFERFESAAEDTPTMHTFDQSTLRRAVATARGEKGKASSLEPLVRYLAPDFEAEKAWFATVIVARAETQVERLATLLSRIGASGRRCRSGESRASSSTGNIRSARARTRNGDDRHRPASRVASLPPPRRSLSSPRRTCSSARRAKRASERGQPPERRRRALSSRIWKTLAVGDFVVHIEHGVGQLPRSPCTRDVGGTRIGSHRDRIPRW